jgi:PAS domain S-box-containing protein
MKRNVSMEKKLTSKHLAKQPATKMKSERILPHARRRVLDRLMLSSILEHIPEIVFFKDRESRFIAMSDSLVRRKGASTTEELIGRSDCDFYSEESAGRMLEDEKQILKTGSPITSKPGKQIWKDGRVTWQLTSKFPLRDRDGSIIGTFGFSRDVTKEFELESALRQADSLIWHADVVEKTSGQLEWRMTHTPSSLFRRIFGKDPPPGYDQLWTEEIVPKWKLINARSAAAILDSKPGYNQQFQVYVRERAFYLDEHVSITKVANRRWNLVGIVVDITSRRKAELALLGARDRISVILEMMSEAVIATDHSNTVAFMNHAAAELTQWSAKEAVGRQVTDILALTDPSSGKPITILSDDFVGTTKKGVTTLHAVLSGRSGNRRHIEVRTVADRNINWRVGAVLVFREVTKS